MESRHIEGEVKTLAPQAVTGTSPSSSSEPQSPAKYRPSILLRRALSRNSRVSNRSHSESSASLSRAPITEHAPSVASLVGAALTFGALSGFLEMGVQAIQLHVLHRVDWSSLMFNRHYAWLCVVVTTIVTTCLTLLLMAPALTWTAWRKTPRRLANAVLLDLGSRRRNSRLACLSRPPSGNSRLSPGRAPGPCASVPAFNCGAASSADRGPGHVSRARSGWSPSSLSPLMRSGSGIALSSAPLQAWSLPCPSAPNLIFIVLDTLRADHMSTLWIPPAHDSRARCLGEEGDHLRHGPLGRALDLALSRDHVHRAMAVAARARVDQPYFGPAPTLAEHLRSRGYATAGVVANVRMCNQVYGVGRGFDTYVDYPWNQEVSFKTAMTSSKLGASTISMVKRLGLAGLPLFSALLSAARPGPSSRTPGTWLERVQPPE